MRGIESAPAGGGIFIPRSDLLGEAGGGIAAHYAASTAAHGRATAFGIPFLGAFLGTFAYYYGDNEHQWRPALGIGLPAVTLALGMGAAGFAARGEDHLQQAIWEYNATLEHSGDGRLSSCPYVDCALRVHHGFFSSGLVRGAEATPVGSEEAPALFAAAGDSARRYYDLFRETRRDTGVSRGIGLGSYLAAGILYAVSDNKVARGFTVGFLVVGYAAGHYSQYGGAFAADQLNHAIWYYNRELGTKP